MTPDEFLASEPDPDQATGISADEFLSGPEPRLSVVGQPPADVHRGRYRMKDPATGDFRRFKNGNVQGIRRTSNFKVAASNGISLSEWKARNVLLGCALRPDLTRKAHGKTHENDKAELDQLVEQIAEAAGAKVSADEGTYLHEFTEFMDAGLKTWRDAPPAYQDSLRLYAEALEAAELVTVPGMIERSTMIQEFGGVAGSLDRLFMHVPTGTYLIGDLKTGKTMDYGLEETEVQEWTYAHGLNQSGYYDWNDHTWHRLDRPVSETAGVIIHMPVQGPKAGTVQLVHADLVNGRLHAELCGRILDRHKNKVRDWEPPTAPVAALNAADMAVWTAAFSGALTRAQAREVFDKAVAAGLNPDMLNRLATDTLTRLDTQADAA